MRERRSVSVLVAALLPALAWAGACGKVKSADTSGGAGSMGTAGTGAAGTGASVHVTVSGTAAPHPLNKLLGADEDFSMLKVSIVDPTSVIANPNATPLGSMALDTTTPGNCDLTTTGCKWSLAGVDITKQTLGLVGTLEDTRAADARLWVKTGTGMGSADDLVAVRAVPAPIIDRRAFAVSRKLEAKLAAFVTQALGVAVGAGELEARGFLIGHIVDKLSTGAMPAGVAGATVTALANDIDIIYPNDTFSAAGTATASSGIFLMVPRMTKAVVTTWEVVKPPGDARTWPTLLAGSNPNNAFVIIFAANE